jgi:hypothetical protein
MKTRRLAFILLILTVLFMAEVRLHDSGSMSKASRGTPSLWAPPKPAQGSEYPPPKFVDPPMPPVPPGPTPRERNRQR